MSRLAVSASDLVERLRARYAAPKWASFAEVRNGTGYTATGAIDFLSIGCWPSQGLLAVGVEIKVSRSDFQRELDRPTKRGWVEASCAECWFCTPKGLLRPEEIPARWGLLEAVGDGLKLRAKVKPAQDPEKRPDHELWVSIVRQAAEKEGRLLESAEHFLDVQGASMSLARLRSMFHRWEERRGHEVAEHLAYGRAMELRQEAKASGAEWWRRWRDTMTVLERATRTRLGLSYGETPTTEQVHRCVADWAALERSPELVKRLRALADALDGGAE